jgi:PAS domain S-box-containing protein
MLNGIQNRLISLQKYFPLMIVLIAGALLSSIAFAWIYRWEAQNVQRNFMHIAHDHIHAFKREVEFKVEIIQSLASLYQSSENVTREEFSSFVYHLSLKHPDIQAFTWIPIVSHENRNAFEAKAYEEGLTDFQLTELDRTGALKPAATRKAYLPINYVEPIQQNRSLLGFDIASEPRYLKVLEQSRDTGVMKSMQLSLPMKAANEKTLMILMPIYRRHTVLDTFIHRKIHFEGFVAIFINIPLLIQNNMQFIDNKLIFEIYELSNAVSKNLLYTSQAMEDKTETLTEQNYNKEWVESMSLAIAEQNWLIQCRAKSDFFSTVTIWHSWIVLISGMFSTCLIAVYLKNNLTRLNEIEKLAVRLSQEVIERQALEHSLRQSETKYRTLLETLPQKIFLKDKKCVYIYCNQNYANELDIDVEAIVGKTDYDFFPIEIAEKYRADDREVVKTGKTKDTEERYVSHQAELTVRTIKTPLKSDSGKIIGVLGIFWDISSRKQLEQELKSYKNHLEQMVCQRTQELAEKEELLLLLFETVGCIIIFLSNDCAILRLNKETERFLGLCKQDAIGKNFFEICFSESQQAVEALRFHHILSGEHLRNVEYPITSSCGKQRLIVWNADRIVNGQGQTIGVILSGQDITARKAAEQSLKDSLKEKEVLLQEIHHRVKNNMQVISSLIGLQQTYIQEQAYIEMFQESQNRIKTMALVHEKLYQSNGLAAIDFGDYVGNLCNNLLISFGNQEHILCEIESDCILLGIDKAIPCGLIINELVSNAFKHAFPNGRDGKIEIRILSLNDCEVELSVSDNGVGAPENLDFRNTETLGLHIVVTLVKQLKGRIDLDRKGSTTFTIQFKQ